MSPLSARWLAVYQRAMESICRSRQTIAWADPLAAGRSNGKAGGTQHNNATALPPTHSAVCCSHSSSSDSSTISAAHSSANMTTTEAMGDRQPVDSKQPMACD